VRKVVVGNNWLGEVGNSFEMDNNWLEEVGNNLEMEDNNCLEGDTVVEEHQGGLQIIMRMRREKERMRKKRRFWCSNNVK
jgi:hypothetical protein